MRLAICKKHFPPGTAIEVEAQMTYGMSCVRGIIFSIVDVAPHVP